MKLKHTIVLLLLSLFFVSCSKTDNKKQQKFNYFSEQFADVKVLRYKVPGFDKLSVKQKALVYYLTQAGLSGRDIMYDQNYRYNLTIRHAFEHIYKRFAQKNAHKIKR